MPIGLRYIFFEFRLEKLFIVLMVLIILDLSEVDNRTAFGINIVRVLFLRDFSPFFIDSRDKVVVTTGTKDVLYCWGLALCLLEGIHLNYRFLNNTHNDHIIRGLSSLGWKEDKSNRGERKEEVQVKGKAGGRRQG